MSEPSRHAPPVSAHTEGGARNKLDNWTDAELRNFLEMVDQGPWEVTDWEAKFLESVVYQYKGPLSPKQRKTALEIIERYIEV